MPKNNREHYTRVFTDPESINELIELRVEGWSIKRLSEHFSCDSSSVLYQLQKNVEGLKIYSHAKWGVKKTKADHCPVCSMLLTSEYHKRYPCN